jgi:hypothetical protein
MNEDLEGMIEDCVPNCQIKSWEAGSSLCFRIVGPVLVVAIDKNLNVKARREVKERNLGLYEPHEKFKKITNLKDPDSKRILSEFFCNQFAVKMMEAFEEQTKSLREHLGVRKLNVDE